jgi:uncharacterized protein
MNGVIDFLTNRILISVVLSYFIAGCIKVFFNYVLFDKIDLMFFFRTGGMPSSHTASVAAMTTTIFLLEGFSNLFFVCLILSLIIISDAVGIRRAAGKQAQVLNTVIQEFRHFRKFRTRRLYELLGHTPKQVVVGAILGIIVARVVFLF